MARGRSTPGSTPKRAAKASQKPERKTQDEVSSQQENRIPLDIQQKSLDIFRDALRPGDDEATILQEVKGHLYNRDFASAFGKGDYLRVYASRWSPSRALAYATMFAEVTPARQPAKDGHADERSGSARMLCLGGGAGGELVGLAAWLSSLDRESGSLHVDLVDVADWQSTVEVLQKRLITAPELSKYASQAKKDSNKPLLSEQSLSCSFHRIDVLSSDTVDEEALTKLLREADIVTFMFTLNELYSISLPATQALLKRVAKMMKPTSSLLVVDSPGSYSTVSLNGAEKKYPMQWLLDHTLLASGTKSGNESVAWEKVVDDQSRWFRLDKSLQYPIALEDMRFQMHLYQRT